MHWLVKAGFQKAISVLPRSDAVNYAFQRKATHSLPRPSRSFADHVREALRHLDVFAQRGTKPIGEARFYEFGAGWDLVGPLTYWACGVEEQILVDLRPNARLELIEDTMCRLPEELRKQGRPSVRTWPDAKLGDIDDLSRLGIRYLAPCDARDTSIADNEIDFVSSTYTLEHIPQVDIEGILGECARILRSDGIISCSIDFKDHYSYFDPGLSPYNFLRYSDWAWALVNSRLHFQNRLRLPNYLTIFADSDLRLIEQEVEAASPREIAGVEQMPLAKRFTIGYTPWELAAKTALLVGTPGSTFGSPTP